MPTATELKKKLIKEMPKNLAHIQKTMYPSIDKLKEWTQKDTVDVEVKSIVRYHRSIGNYILFHYVDASLHAMPEARLLDHSTRASVAQLLYTIPVYDYHPNNLSIYYLTSFGEMLPRVLLLGWEKEAELCARLAFKYINTVFDRGIGAGYLGWFMLLLAQDWLKPKNINLMTDFRKIEVKSLGPVWDKALQNWRCKDMNFVEQLINEMADYHLSNTKPIKVKGDELHADFEARCFWIYPIEILALLRLREMHGLANPPLSHPLFSTTPLAKLNPPTQWPKDELMDAAEKRFRAIYPQTPSLDDLATLRLEQS